MAEILKRVQAEIDDIHAFFTEWVNGTCPGDDDTLQKRALDRIADNGRQTTMILRDPGGDGFEILQVHEAWLPPEEVEDGDFNF